MLSASHRTRHLPDWLRSRRADASMRTWWSLVLHCAKVLANINNSPNKSFTEYKWIRCRVVDDGVTCAVNACRKKWTSRCCLHRSHCWQRWHHNNSDVVAASFEWVNSKTLKPSVLTTQPLHPWASFVKQIKSVNSLVSQRSRVIFNCGKIMWRFAARTKSQRPMWLQALLQLTGVAQRRHAT
jgi:hypothetical protein